MIAAFILALHLFVVGYVFLTHKKDGVGEGFLAVVFICIVFTVGWTISTILTNLIFSISYISNFYWQPLDSWVWIRLRKEFNRDTISLIILTFAEIIFYFRFFPFKTDKDLQQQTDNSNEIKKDIP